MPLDELERLVVNCRIMRLKKAEARAYLKGHGYDLSQPAYQRLRLHIERTKSGRLYEIARRGFVDQHLERLDQLELIQQEMWKNYHLEGDPTKKTRILRMIADVQPFLSAYIEATKEVMEHNVLSSKGEGFSLPAFGKKEEKAGQ